MKKLLHNIIERIKSRLDGRTETEYHIVADDKSVRLDWLTIENERGSLEFLWESVIKVVTFKLDLFCVDCICLAFETPEQCIELNELMHGWDYFLSQLEPNLPGFPSQKGWWWEVMAPAFASNEKELWRKGKTTDSEYPTDK